LKKSEVTLLVMSVFSIVQMKQEVALGMCDHLQDLAYISKLKTISFERAYSPTVYCHYVINHTRLHLDALFKGWARYARQEDLL